MGRAPLVLQAKEGLSLVNGTPCATGLAALALHRSKNLFDWADGIAAMSFENLGGQIAAFGAESLALRMSEGLQTVGARLRTFLAASRMIEARAGTRTQDALSLRAVPHVHGAARDVFDAAARAVDDELASVTDNPAIAGTPEAPRVFSEAHAVGARIALAMDALKTAVAEVGAMAERRLDRLINPLVSGLPPFLAQDSGAQSGFMIAHYTTAALVAENRRLAAPASLDGGITSALQEDHLVHATTAATQALAILDNARTILAVEALANAQAYDLQGPDVGRASGTDAIFRSVRVRVPTYRDDRPFAGDIGVTRKMIEDRPAF
jgi:histidine ammonia-lyase